jgi:hypothetical protein
VPLKDHDEYLRYQRGYAAKHSSTEAVRRWRKNRGLLHSKCNIGIGQFDDSPSRCELAASYLRRWL